MACALSHFMVLTCVCSWFRQPVTLEKTSPFREFIATPGPGSGLLSGTESQQTGMGPTALRVKKSIIVNHTAIPKSKLADLSLWETMINHDVVFEGIHFGDLGTIPESSRIFHQSQLDTQLSVCISLGKRIRRATQGTAAPVQGQRSTGFDAWPLKLHKFLKESIAMLYTSNLLRGASPVARDSQSVNVSSYKVRTLLCISIACSTAHICWHSLSFL